MKTSAFLVEYGRHRALGLTVAEALDAAASSPRVRAGKIACKGAQPEVVPPEKTPADRDVINKPLLLTGSSKPVSGGDGRGRFILVVSR